MNKFLILVLMFALGVSCAARRENKIVKEEAAQIPPTSSPRIQYDRAVSMVKINPDLSDDQKNRLIDTINKYSDKMFENKEKLSQYRTVLMEEMLKSEKNQNEKIAAAKKDITDLNKQASKILEDFVDDFKSIIGKSANHNQPELLEVILVD